MPNLTVIFIQANGRSGMGIHPTTYSWIYSLPNVTSLTLEDNSAVSFPAVPTGLLTALNYLTITMPQVTMDNTVYFALTNLVSLSVNVQNFTILPGYNMLRLTTFSASGVYDSSLINGSLSQYASITDLSLWGEFSRLIDIPPGLQTLHIPNSQLNDLSILCGCTSTLISITVQNSNLTWIPECFTALGSSPTLDVTNNSISNFSIYNNLTVTNWKTVILSGNPFNEPIPVNWMANTQIGQLHLGNCGFGGLIAQLLHINFNSSSPELYVSHNHFIGTLDSVGSSLQAYLTVDLSYNELSGLIPPSIYCYPEKLNKLILNNNQFNGFDFNVSSPCVRPNFINIDNNMVTNMPGLNSNISMQHVFDLSASNNPLNTEIDFTLFLSNYSSITNLDLSNCGLTGTLPPGIGLNGVLPSIGPLETFLVNWNSLTGEIPASFWNSSNTHVLFLGLAGNQFSSMEILPASDYIGYIATYEIDISSNQLTGEIPPAFNYLASAYKLNISHNSFTGPPPMIASAPCRSLIPFPLDLSADSCFIDISYNMFDCCNVTVYNMIGYGTCVTSDNPVSPLQCPSLYPPQCIPPLPTIPPYILPVSSSPTCHGTSPGSDFSCQDGIWVSPTPVSSSSLSISSPTVITGNLTIGTSGISFSSITNNNGSAPFLSITGCISSESGSLPDVTIQISSSDADYLASHKGTTQTLLQQGSECPQSLLGLHVNIQQSGNNCKKVSASTSQSTSSSLVVVFSVNTIGCDVWWIVVAAVLGSLVIIAVVIIVLLLIFNDKFRSFIRPFSGRGRAEASKVK